MPAIGRVLETALYTANLQRARAFYEGSLGLKLMVEDSRMIAYAVGDTVLLLFRRGDSNFPVKMPSGTIPPHDASGAIHVAFAVAAEELADWEKTLASYAIDIESRVKWPKGGESIYFRDPDGNLLEFATPGLWENY
jgi:catechol 2,3-dioxygenase-like lactoylglutathione lyase family enzyme